MQHSRPRTQHSALHTEHSAPSTQHRPIRVVRIIDRLNVGGPAKHVVWLSAGLGSERYETTLVTGSVAPGEGDMMYFAHAAGIEPVIIQEMSRELSLRDLLVVGRLIKLLWKTKPEIIHTHKAKAGAVGRAAAFIYKWLTPGALVFRPRRCRVVHTYHGHVFHSYFGKSKTRLFIMIEQLLARFCTDRIVAISKLQRWEIHERFGVGRAGQFRVVPLGIDLGEEIGSGVSIRKNFGIGAQELVIGAVGRLCEVKNYAALLRAVALLPDSLGPVRLVLVGDGHLRCDLERQARDLGIAGRVAFTGLRRDVNSLYAEFDIVALTSLNEGTPLTLIEALASGRPVAAVEVGGVIDLMGKCRSTAGGFSVWDHGVTAPSGDDKAFARAMEHMLNRVELRREAGERARIWARQHYSKERLIADIDRLYQEFTGSKAAEKVQSRHSDAAALYVPSANNAPAREAHPALHYSTGEEQ